MFMTEIIGNIAMFMSVTIFFVTIFGIFKPFKFVKFKHRRIIIAICGFTIFIILANIGSYLLPELNKPAIDNKELTTITDSSNIENKILDDSTIVKKYVAGYSELIEKLKEDGANQKEIHAKIYDLIYNQWWNEIQIRDSLKLNTEYSRRAYKKYCLKYDKIYANWIKYGDADFDRIEYWTKIEAKDLLRKVCTDPESVVVEAVSFQGKTKNGWKSIVQYRAKNGYGGYVREYVTLVLTYDADNDIYKAIDISE